MRHGQSKSLVRFQLAPALWLLAFGATAGAGEIRGRILVAGVPAAGATLAAVPYEAPIDEARRLARRGEAPRPLTTATTRPDGSFVLSVAAVPALAFRLQAQGGGVAPSWLEGTFDSTESEDLGDHTLPRAQSLAGRVVNASGAAVAGAEVTVIAGALGAQTDPDVAPASRTVRTGADGTFRCDEAGAGANRLLVEAKGYGATSIANVGSGTMPRPIALGPGASLSGIVLRADRKTRAGGALVRFESGGVATRWVETGADGAFLLADLPPRTGRVIVDAGEAGMGGASAGGSRAPAALTIVLAPPATLAGSVIDVGSRALVPRARITLEDGDRTLLARGGPDGRYAVRGLAPERPYRLKVDEPRYASFERGGILLVTGETKRLDVPLRRAASISGRVVDESGKPVANALGRLVSRGDNTFADRLRMARGGGRVVFRSAADGSFTATGLAPGEDQRLTVLHPDFEPRLVAGLSLTAGGSKAGLTVVLRRGLTATGIVRDDAGRPVPDAEVEMLPLRGFGGRGGGAFAGGGPPGRGGRGAGNTGGASRPAATSRGDGRFEVKGLSEGDYELSVSKDGYADQSVVPVRVRADPVPSVEVTLAAGASIRGSVVRPDGSGAEGYGVRAVPSGSRRVAPPGGANAVTTAADGSFLIGGLRPGESYDVVTLARDRPVTRREGVDAPTDGIEIILPTPGRISGRVVDAQTLSPVADFQVAYGPDRSSGGGGFGPGGRGGGGRGGFAGAPGGRGDRQALHSDDGSFVLDEVPAGTWEVVAQAEGYQTARVGGITLEEGGTRSGVDVRLRRGASIQGQVLDANTGQPILDVAITLRRPGGAGAVTLAGDADARTDGDGHFAVEGLGPGSYTVMARHPDYADGSALVEVKDAPVAADLRLTPGGSVGGTVLSEANAPLPGATVTLGAGGGGFGRGGAFAGAQTTMSDDGGRFRFTHVTAGRYAVSASVRSRQTLPVELVLQAGEARENLVLSLAAGARIHGLVTGLPSALRGNVNVTASGPDGFFTSSRAGADGSFELAGAPVGPINLRATASDTTGSTRSATSQVSVTDGQTDLEADIAFETGFTLSGTVTRAGQAVSGATVSAGLQGGGGRMASARTDESGAYRLEGLVQGSYTVTAGADGGRPQRQTATLSDDTTLDFVLPSARVTGVVVEAGSQQPLPDATVQAAPQDATGPPGRGASTDSNGRFSIDGLEPQTYVVSARKPGYQVESKNVTPADGGAEDVVLALVRGDGIGLEVRDAQFGVPVRAAQARAVDGQGAVAFAGGVMLDSDGRGEIPSLRPGSYVLTLYAAGYAPAVLAATSPSPRVFIAVSPGGTLEIHAGAKTLAAGTARGQILTADGQPYPFSPFSGDGHFTLSAPIRRLENLGAGSYLLQMDAGGSPQQFQIAVGSLVVVTLP